MWAGSSAPIAGGAEGIEIRVPRGSVAIRGRLVDADGAPVEEALVRASRAGEENRSWLCAAATTAADGSFRIFGAPAGRLRFVTWRKGREVRLGDADAPTESLELRLPR
jgi:carboxypeptidase family protein